jgi:hypothetical protein
MVLSSVIRNYENMNEERRNIALKMRQRNEGLRSAGHTCLSDCENASPTLPKKAKTIQI